METKSKVLRFAKRFGLVLPGIAALAGCVDPQPAPDLGATSEAVTSTTWDCTTTCSCRFTWGVKMETTTYYSSTSTVSAATAQEECDVECIDYDPWNEVSAMAGPTTCTPISTNGSGSGSGSAQ